MKNTKISIRLYENEHKKLNETKNILNYDYDLKLSYQSLTEYAINKLFLNTEAKAIAEEIAKAKGI